VKASPEIPHKAHTDLRLDVDLHTGGFGDLKTKEEVLRALVVRGAIVEYVTVEGLLKDPVLRNVRPKTLGVRLLRLRREGLVTKKNLGKVHAYRLTIKGVKRLDYFRGKSRIMEEKVEQFKRRIDEEYNKMMFQKLLEAAKDEQGA
jgi:DNA-binding PadR family transcriptional regulator